MSDKDERDGIPFQIEMDVNHNIPPEVQDKVQIVDNEECQKCGTDLRRTSDHEPGSHYCSECGMYMSVGSVGTTILGP